MIGGCWGVIRCAVGIFRYVGTDYGRKVMLVLSEVGEGDARDMNLPVILTCPNRRNIDMEVILLGCFQFVYEASQDDGAVIRSFVMPHIHTVIP